MAKNCETIELAGFYYFCNASYKKLNFSVTESLPGPPRNVRIEQTDAHTVVVRWDEPAKNPHTVYMYRVFWRQVGSRSPSKNDTKNTQLRITGLKEGEKYECVVKAGNHRGTSTLTDPIRFTLGDKYITSSSSIGDIFFSFSF